MQKYDETKLTLREWREMILNSESLDPVLGLIKINKQVRVRFVYTPTSTEFDDGDSVAFFKKYVELDAAIIVIDDGGGGVLAPGPRPKELV